MSVLVLYIDEDQATRLLKISEERLLTALDAYGTLSPEDFAKEYAVWSSLKNRLEMLLSLASAPTPDEEE